MLTINFTPQRNDKGQLVVNWNDPLLTVDGIEYDLSLIPDGATVEHEILLKVERSSTDYSVELLLPHGGNAPLTTRFPQPLVVTENGPVDVPMYNEEVPNELA